LEGKIKSKLETAEENRLEKLNALTERLKEHEKHVEEVRKATNNTKEDLEEKIIQKLQNALQYREEQLEKIKEKIREHERHADEVRDKARNQSPNASFENKPSTATTNA